MVRRQQLVSEDYKVSKGLVRACKEEIVQHKCFKDSVNVKDRKVKLAQVLLCLENALHAGIASPFFPFFLTKNIISRLFLFNAKSTLNFFHFTRKRC